MVFENHWIISNRKEPVDQVTEKAKSQFCNMTNDTSINLELILAFPKCCYEFRTLRFVSAHYFLSENLCPQRWLQNRACRIILSAVHQREVIYLENSKQTRALHHAISAS